MAIKKGLFMPDCIVTNLAKDVKDISPAYGIRGRQKIAIGKQRETALASDENASFNFSNRPGSVLTTERQPLNSYI